MMRFDIMTLFPELVDRVLSESIIGRARRSGAIEVNVYNIRDYSEDKNRRVMIHFTEAERECSWQRRLSLIATMR